MTLSKKDKPALLLIDIQKAFDDIEYWGGERNNVQAEDNAGKLLNFWRDQRLPIFHIQHCSANPNGLHAEGKIGNEFKDMVKPIAGEPVIKKSINSAFIGTDLKQQLDNNQIQKVVIIGLTTDHCVSTTTRMAGNFGYDTYLVSDATATFCKKGIDGQIFSAALIHDTALASLNQEFATVVMTNELINHLNEN